MLVLAAARSEDRSQKKRGIFGEHQGHSNNGNSFGSLTSGGSSSSWKPIFPSYGAPSSRYGSTGDLSINALPAAHSNHGHDFSTGSLASGHHHSHDSGVSGHLPLADFSAGSLSPIPQPPTDLSSAQLSSASFPLEGLSSSAFSHDHGSSGGISLGSLSSGSPLTAFQTADAPRLGLSSGLESNGAFLSSGSISPSFAAGGSSFGGLSPALFSSAGPTGNLPSGSAFPAGLPSNGLQSGDFSSGSGFPAGLSSNGLQSGDFSSLPTLGVGTPITIGRHVTVTNRVAVPVPQPYPVTVYRDVPVPVHHTVQVPVSRPYPVPVAKPYPVTVIKHVPVTVEKRVPYPVPHPVPYAVYKPVAVPIAKPVAVPVVKEVPYPVAKPYAVYQQKEASSWR